MTTNERETLCRCRVDQEPYFSRKFPMFSFTLEVKGVIITDIFLLWQMWTTTSVNIAYTGSTG